jgi:membrane-bound lytic murein transglycosylase A
MNERAVIPARCSALRRLMAAMLYLLGAQLSAAEARELPPLNIPNSQIEPAAWTDLDGWTDDDHEAAFKTFLASCKAILPQSISRDDRPLFAALRDVCRVAAAAKAADGEQARAFFEKNFRPLWIATLGASTGLLTGYYEPIVDGSRTQSEEYNVPLYRRPSNLVVRGRPRSAEAFPNKGQVGRRVGRRKMVPYWDRGEIEDGILTGRGLEICWLKDPVDAFFIQIQGSARVRLPDGGVLRVNYDAHNGWPYTPIGKPLIDRGILTRDEMSMERLRQWMQANPAEGKELRRQNRSYIFFRETGIPEKDEPTGAQGIPVTAGRSLAVDRGIHVFGTPFFISAELPIENGPPKKFRRLMVAQDTGSAIVGVARADIYFGAGNEAGQMAGRIRHQGRFAILVPREIDPAKAAADVPLPKPRPAMQVARAGSRGKLAGKESSVSFPLRHWKKRHRR